MPGATAARFSAGQFRVLVLTWVAYVGFNIARKTVSISKRRLQLELGASVFSNLPAFPDDNIHGRGRGGQPPLAV